MATIDRKNKFSLILYSSRFGPRYFSVSRSLFNLFCLGPPAVAVVAVTLTVLGAVYFKQLRSVSIYQERRLVESLREDNDDIQKQLIASQNSAANSREKLSTRMPAHAQASAGLLSIFSPSIGRRDTTAEDPSP